MDPNQAWRDTISLLAGGSVPRSKRPGEQFEPPNRQRRRLRALLTLLAAGLLLAVRITPVLIILAQ